MLRNNRVKPDQVRKWIKCVGVFKQVLKCN
jgi:hypothetical protein